MSEHPIAEMIRDIEDLRKQADAGSICANIDVCRGVSVCADIVLKTIHRRLTGGAWVDVSGPKCRASHAHMGEWCEINQKECPGLGVGDCPAFTMKGE